MCWKRTILCRGWRSTQQPVIGVHVCQLIYSSWCSSTAALRLWFSGLCSHLGDTTFGRQVVWENDVWMTISHLSNYWQFACEATCLQSFETCLHNDSALIVCSDVHSSACKYNGRVPKTTYNKHVNMLHDTIKCEALFKDNMSSKCPTHSPKRLVAQTSFGQMSCCPND